MAHAQMHGSIIHIREQTMPADALLTLWTLSCLIMAQVLDGFDNQVDGNVGMVAIFWNTHRGSLQGKGLPKLKLYVSLCHKCRSIAFGYLI
jgi:hypothetical protein